MDMNVWPLEIVTELRSRVVSMRAHTNPAAALTALDQESFGMALIAGLPITYEPGLMEDADFSLESFSDGSVSIRVRWLPLYRPIALVGGPAAGKVYAFPDAPAASVVAVSVYAQRSFGPYSLDLFQSGEVETLPTATLHYRLSGWDPRHRHWRYSIEEQQ